MLFNTTPGSNIPQKSLASIIQAMINASLGSFIKSGSYYINTPGSSVFTVNIGTRTNSYTVSITPTTTITAAPFYVSNKPLLVLM